MRQPARKHDNVDLSRRALRGEKSSGFWRRLKLRLAQNAFKNTAPATDRNVKKHVCTVQLTR
jgi:hypothetical protein